MKVTYILAVSMLTTMGAMGVNAAILPPPPSEVPVTIDDCKNDGWKNYNGLFKNQGDCVSFIATNGKNEPDGPNAPQ